MRGLLCCATLLLFSSLAIAELPADEAQSEIEAICTPCHSVNLIESSSGYSRADWSALIATMIGLSDSPGLEARITGYLAEHYPPNDRRTPNLIAGPVEIDFETSVVPTLGQRSRDPAEAPDGAIWWTGQSGAGNNIGRIDPETGEVWLPEGTHPHSVNPHPTGDIWYLGNRNGTVGVVDGETYEIKKIFEMPTPEARDPHTGEFDRQGRFWFTLQHSNMVDRIDPETDRIDLTTLDRPRSRPYGIKIAADGTIWYGNSGAGRLGHYDPETGAIREWSSPSGPESHPYGLVVVDGIVWYNESGMRPDPLVRFDPETETFQSWPIPSSGVYAGILRHTRADAQGRLLIHQSSTNHILRVSPSAK